jgi:hypothetical protein
MTPPEFLHKRINIGAQCLWHQKDAHIVRWYGLNPRLLKVPPSLPATKTLISNLAIFFGPINNMLELLHP